MLFLAQDWQLEHLKEHFNSDEMCRICYKDLCFTRATVAIARVLTVVVSVCPPVCHSVLLKGPNVGLRKLCTVAQGLQFSDAKYLGKIQTPSVTPNGGAKRKLGVIKIGDFRQITHYNSKTVEDRHIVLFKSIRKS